MTKAFWAEGRDDGTTRPDATPIAKTYIKGMDEP
jgi:hypothetical protein